MQPLNKTIGHFLTFVWLAAVSLGFTAINERTAYAQGAGRGPIAETRDPEVEKASKKSLDAAKFYFYKRKPNKDDKEGMARLNKAVLDRLNEIIDTNQNFARMDEVFFLMAEVYARDNQPDKANEFYSLIVKNYTDSQHYAEAKRKLGATVEAKPKESKPEKKG